jgi:hypothetical protein
MIFDRALTIEEIEFLYNEGNGTETLPGEGMPLVAFYVANGWSFDVTEDFEVQIDFHHSSISDRDSWVGITIENDEDNYVSLSAGCDSYEPYFYHETGIDGMTFFGETSRSTDDGILYISYNASEDELYLSFTGYGEENAWETISGVLQSPQWASETVNVTIGGGSDSVALSPGEAYLDNFETTRATLVSWQLADFDTDGDVDFQDFAIFASAWQSSVGDGNWNPVCDISGSDNVIDVLDLAVFTKYWLIGIN